MVLLERKTIFVSKNRKQNYNNKSGFKQFWFTAVDTDDDANKIVIWSATANSCKGKNARKKLKFYYLIISTSRTCQTYYMKVKEKDELFTFTKGQ